MGRFGSIATSLLVIAFLAALLGCGGSTPATPGFGVPAVIRLAPTPTTSIDLGTTLQFSASALSGSKTTLNPTFTFFSSNPNIVSIANNGLACAGTWDSVAVPVVCTPGGVGKATITAASSGVVSAPTVVYVHQHIAQISVSAVPIQTLPQPFQPPQPPFPASSCYTMASGSLITAQSQTYTATALADDPTGKPTVDITSTVGPFSWAASQSSVADVTPLNSFGIPNGQAQVTAHTPGLTQITASIADTSSGPVSFLTCPVQSISLAVNGTGGNSISGAKGTSSSTAATVYDIAGNLISPTLTWSSSDNAVASVSSSGGITSPGVGGASITASCVAPTCNINLSPPQPIYPPLPINGTYTGTTSTPFSVFVASSAAKSATNCATNLHCQAFLVPISGTPPIAASPVLLTSFPNEIPNSIQFAPAGATAYMGTQKGLMAVSTSANPPTITLSPRVTGQVLAISPDGKKVIVSDNLSPVHQVFVFDTATSTFTNFLISGVTAAAFSPDSLKAFILAGSTLYVYSTQSAFQTATLTVPGTDVAFLPNGMFGYIAQGSAGTSYTAVCNNPGQSLATQIFTAAAPMSFIRPLIDGSGFVGLQPPNLTFIDALITPSTPPTPNSPLLPPGASGCPTPFPSGVFSVTNSVSSIDLGAGVFNPLAFLVSSDSQAVYIVVRNSPTIIVFNLLTKIQSTLSLAGSPNPIAAALAPDGQTLYVTGSDSKVHFISTVSGGDLYQVDVPPSTLCTITSGGTQPNCLPDLLAVKP